MKKIDINSAKEITANYKQEILDSRVGKILVEKINAPIEPTSIGEIAPILKDLLLQEKYLACRI